MARIVVVGAGMGGLAAAARLRVKGHDVTICEQSATFGGKLGSVTRDGFTFDTGPSLLTLPAVYRDLFNKTGGPLEDALDLVPLDIAFRYTFADGSHVDVPGVDPARCARAFGDAFGGAAAADWRELMERAGRMWRITRTPFLESPLNGPRDVLALARRPSDVTTIAPWRSLRGIGRATLGDPRLRMVLDRYATYSGSDPRKAPAALATVPYVEQAFGAWHVAGGLRQLGVALERRCRERGVNIRFGADVAEITTCNGAVSGVRLVGGEGLPADIVVADADAQHVYADLVRTPDSARAVRRIRRATPSLAGFVILLAVRGRTPGMRHHNVSFPAHYDSEFDAIFGREPHPVDDPAIYICVPDDPAMRPDDDHESWFILVNAPRHGHGPGLVDWTAPGRAAAYADHVLTVLARRGTDVRERILWREVRTPADLEHSTRAPGGSIYGTSSNGRSAAFLRPANRSPVPGLFLVGGSAHPGGGLPLVGMSADIVAGLIGRA